MKKTKSAQPVETIPRRPRHAVMHNHWVYMGLLFAIVLFLFAPFLFSDRMLYCSDQLTGIDSRVFLRDALVDHHQFPMWFSTRLSGQPTVDASFGDATYPPSVAIDVLLPMHRAFGMKFVLHILLAGVFFYLLLYRGFRAPPLVAFIGAVLYMLNPQFVSHVYPGHGGKVFVIAWLPFIVWRMKSLAESPGLLNATLLALGVGISMYAGHVQIVYFMLWGLFIYWCFALVLQWLEHRRIRALVPLGAYFWLAVFLGLGMSFVQFFPAYMFVRDAHGVRGVERGFEYAASWSLHWPEIFSLWVPEFVGASVEKFQYYWSENYFKLNTEYAGAMATILAVLAVVFKPKPWRLLWGSIAVLAVLFSLGAHTPLFHIAYHLIPGVRKMRASSMMMFWYSFSLVLLSSLFLADVLKGKYQEISSEMRGRWLRGLAIALVAITVLALLFSIKGFVLSVVSPFVPSLVSEEKRRAFGLNFSRNFVSGLWIWWIFAVTTIGLLLGVVSGKINRYWFVAAVLAIGIVDTVRIDSKFIQVVPKSRHFYSSPILADLHEKMKTERFRCFALRGTLPTNGAGVYGLEGVGDFFNNELRWYRRFRGDETGRNFLHGLIGLRREGKPYLIPRKLREGNNFLNLANVKYTLSRRKNRIVALENKGTLGRLSFVPGWAVMEDDDAVEALKNDDWNIREKVILSEEPLDKPARKMNADTLAEDMAKATVVWDTYSPNYRKTVVSTDREGFLRISEVFYPGWKVTVDGKPARVYRADVAWMAVRIGKGEHTVEMRPKSLYLRKASFVSAPVILSMVVYWCVLGLLAAARRRGNAQGKENA